MEDYQVKRLDHLGIVAGTIKELGIIETIDEIFGTDKREEISTGESVAGMIINGLGFTSQPLSLTERFFKSKPLKLLFGRENINSSYFNRNKLSKTLDKLYYYNCEKLFYELSLQACSKAKIDLSCNSLDTTSLSVSGEYDKDSDEHAINLTYGFSKDHRPDLKQCVHELLVSQDGGVPLMMKSYSGNASDSKIFTERTKMLLKNFKSSTGPRYLVADSKLYCSNNANNLSQIKYITRIPSTLKVIKDNIAKCYSQKSVWNKISNEESYIKINIEHYNILQRWLIVSSKQSQSRAKKRIQKAVAKEYNNYKKKFKEFSNYTFSSKEEAVSNLKKLCKKMEYHTLSSHELKSTEDSENYTITGIITESGEAIKDKIDIASCYVVGTNITCQEVNDKTIIELYKKQNMAIENTGFRFLKEPKFFTQSFFIKKPERIEALLFIMTLALLVYSIAQRKIRLKIKEQHETVPDQINKPTDRPTLKWIFQLMDDVTVIYKTVNSKINIIMTGLDKLKQKIIGFFGKYVENLYQPELSYVA